MRALALSFTLLYTSLMSFSAFADLDIGAAQKKCLPIARAWVELVDRAKYDQSWKESAAFFQSHVKKEQWKKDAIAARAQVGKFESREFKDTSYTQDAPELPKGDYILVQFWASFSKKKKVIENISLFREGDEWKVIGYFIQ